MGAKRRIRRKIKPMEFVERRLIRNEDVAPGTLTKDRLAANTVRMEVPIPLGYIPTGLDVSTTGVKSETKQYLISADALQSAKAAYFESDLQTLASGAAVNLELYDYTASAVRATLSLNAATKRARSENILTSLVSGNPVGVRFNVTTGASGTGGGCSPVLVVVIGVS